MFIKHKRDMEINTEMGSTDLLKVIPLSNCFFENKGVKVFFHTSALTSRQHWREASDRCIFLFANWDSTWGGLYSLTVLDGVW